MSELNSTNLDIISDYISRSDNYGLTPEVVLFALYHMKENPQTSIEDAISYGFNEWVK